MANFSMKRTLPAIIIAAGITVVLVLSATKPTPPAKPSQEQEWGVLAVTIKPGAHRPNLELFGQVESPKQSILTSAISADVIKRLVDEGDRVQKGQILIELDNRDAKYVLAQRSAEVKSLSAQIEAEKVRYQTDLEAIKHEQELVELVEKEVNRRTRLFKTQTGSALELDNARKSLATQRLQLADRQRNITDHKNRLSNLEAQQEKAKAIEAQAQLDVERSQIRAPFDAKVAKIFVSVGNRVQPGNQLIEVFDNTDLEVRTQIPRQYISQVRKALDDGQEINARALINSNVVEMRLDRLATKVESGRSGVDGLFMITTSTDQLELGKNISIFIELRPVLNSIVLPPQSLYGLDRVYKIVDSRLKATQVIRVGNLINRDGSQSILVTSENLKEGQSVMATQLPNAIDGLKVRIKGAPQ